MEKIEKRNMFQNDFEICVSVVKEYGKYEIENPGKLFFYLLI